MVEDEIPAPDVHNQDQDDVGGDRDKGDENITKVRDEFSFVIYSYTVKKAVELLDAPLRNTFLKSNKNNSNV